MNLVNLKIGGKTRPVKFSYSSLALYEDQTGRDMVIDINDILSKSFSAVEQAKAGVPITSVISYRNVSRLAYCGMIGGAKDVNSSQDFTVDDAAEWVLGDDDVMVKIIQLAIDSMPRYFPRNAAAEVVEDKKKVKAKKPIGTS